MGDAILQIFTPTIIVSLLLAIVIFCSRNWILEKIKNKVQYDYDMKLKKFENELATCTQIEMAKLNNRLSMELEIAKTKIRPYLEKQFDLYNELWMSLTDLKHSMFQLWAQASEDRFSEFSKRLKETTMRLERSALIVEERHYAELMSILNKFAQYEMGKRQLIDYRNEQPVASYDYDLVKKMTDDNRETRDRLIQYLPQIRNCLRNQISGCIADQSTEGDRP